MTAKEKIMQKVNNLLNKTVENGCTPQEAGLAASKAQELIAKYHIDMREFSEPEEIDSEDTYCTTPWQTSLATIIANNTCCEVIYTPVGGHRSRKRRLTFVGRETDRKTVVAMWDKFATACRKGIQEEKRKHLLTRGTIKGVENSYAYGFIDAVKNAMNEQCRALMLVTPKEVTEKFYDLFPKAKSVTHNYKIIRSAYESGRSAGRDIAGKKLVSC